MAERDDADAFGLRHAAEIGDRDAGNGVDRLDAVELERLDDKMKAVGQLVLCCTGFRLGLNCGLGHGDTPYILSFAWRVPSHPHSR